MKPKKRLEINIRFVHDIEGEWFRRKFIKFIAIVPFSVGYMDVGRNASSQVKQSVHFDCALAILAQRPRSEYDACRYGRGI